MELSVKFKKKIEFCEEKSFIKWRPLPQPYLGNPFFWFAWRRLERQQNRGRPLPLIPGFENCRIFILQKSSSEENCQIWCNEWLVSGPMGAHGRHGGGRVEATCGLANCLPDTTLVVPWNPTLGSTTMASTPSFAILLTILVVLAAISVIPFPWSLIYRGAHLSILLTDHFPKRFC